MKNKLSRITNEEIAQRVVTFLTREEVDFLDKLGKDALFSMGTKISRAKIISWLVDFIEKLHINGKGIKSEKDFENRIRQVMGQIRGASSRQPRLSAVAEDKSTSAKAEKVDKSGGG